MNNSGLSSWFPPVRKVFFSFTREEKLKSMLRWIKELRAREERQAEERSRFAGLSGQSRGSSHASPAQVEELESSDSNEEEDDGPRPKKQARHVFEPIPKSSMRLHGGVSVECTGKHRCPF